MQGYDSPPSSEEENYRSNLHAWSDENQGSATNYSGSQAGWDRLTTNQSRTAPGEPVPMLYSQQRASNSMQFSPYAGHIHPSQPLVQQNAYAPGLFSSAYDHRTSYYQPAPKPLPPNRSGGPSWSQPRSDAYEEPLVSPTDFDGLPEVTETPKRKGPLPAASVIVMKTWLYEHIDKPYPTEHDKLRMAIATGLTTTQISNWYINARRRLLPQYSLSKTKGVQNEDPASPTSSQGSPTTSSASPVLAPEASGRSPPCDTPKPSLQRESPKFATTFSTVLPAPYPSYASRSLCKPNRYIGSSLPAPFSPKPFGSMQDYAYASNDASLTYTSPYAATDTAGAGTPSSLQAYASASSSPAQKKVAGDFGRF